MSSANTPRIELNPFDDPPGALDNAPYFNSNQSSDYLSSMDTSRPGSAGGNRPKDKKRVGFHPDAEEPSFRKHRPASISLPTRITLTPPSGLSPGFSPSESPFISHSRNSSGTAEPLLPSMSTEVSDQIKAAFASASASTLPPSPTIRVPPRPVLRRGDSALSTVSDKDDENTVQGRRAREAHERGKRLELDERISSAPASRAASPSRILSLPKLKLNLDDIPLEDFTKVNIDQDGLERDALQKSQAQETDELHAAVDRLVRAHTLSAKQVFHTGLASAAATPSEEPDAYMDYVPRPDHYRAGVLGALLKLYNHDGPAESGHDRSSSLPRPGHYRDASSNLTTPQHSPPSSGYNTPVGKQPKPWHTKSYSNSTSSLAHLVSSSAMGASPVSGLGDKVAESLRQQADAKRQGPAGKRSRSNMLNRFSRPRLEEEIRIKKHIAEILARQVYLNLLCQGLMLYGAPYHRLEQYMTMSARVLEVHAQFHYQIGCMIVSYDDNTTHTSGVKMIRVAQGLDFGKLRDVHEVYKEVLRDRLGVEEATSRLDEIIHKRPKHGPWRLVFLTGVAAASVGPFAFDAGWLDLPVCFLLGCIMGLLQFIIAPRNEGFRNMVEIFGTIITSFLARAFGSIAKGKYFCFSALAQSSIALILPGFMVLSAALELQSKSMVAGSSRLVHAIIYSLFLGFSITIGTLIYGAIDNGAISDTTCRKSGRVDSRFNPIAVIIFTLCLTMINQAKWKQIPVMTTLAVVGYLVNTAVSIRFAGNTQVSNMFGALAIGVLANMHSRFGTKIENKMLDVWEDHLRPHVRAFHKRIRGKSTALRRIHHTKKLEAMEAGEASDADSIFVRRTRRVGYGLAAAAMLPAIFVQVPSGLAVSGSLLAGVSAADQITGVGQNGSTVVNATTLANSGINSVAFNVGYSVVQIAIGITVGIFLSTLIVYPQGKKRSGLFSL